MNYLRPRFNLSHAAITKHLHLAYSKKFSLYALPYDDEKSIMNTLSLLLEYINQKMPKALIFASIEGIIS